MLARCRGGAYVGALIGLAAGADSRERMVAGSVSGTSSAVHPRRSSRHVTAKGAPSPRPSSFNRGEDPNVSDVIVGGLAAYEDQTRVEGYPQVKARVELRFDVPEGGDAEAILDAVTAKAKTKVFEMLKAGGKAPTRTTAAPAVAAADAGATAPAAPTTTKEDLAKAAGVSKADEKKAAKKAPAAAKKDGGGDATDMSEFDVPGTTPAEAMSDADLLAAVQKKNAALKNPDKIRALIGQYNPKPGEPFQVKQIAAEQRADFITKLDALT